MGIEDWQFHHAFTLSDTPWGTVQIIRIMPRQGDPWGALAPLRDTPWGKLIPQVSGEAYSHALHGHIVPLMREIGPAPQYLLKQLPGEFRRCASASQCLTFKPHSCQPCARMPACYSPPGVDGIAAGVAQAWRDGCYVVVVVGDEFSL